MAKRFRGYCSIEGCERPIVQRSMCRVHSLRVATYGDPFGGRTPNGEAQKHYRDVVSIYEGDDCLIWPYTRNTKGYAVCKITGDCQQIVSRVLCEETYGPPPTKRHQAAHSCGNGYDGCVTKKHLRWATPAENTQDRIDHGKQIRGEMCSYRKLNEPQVLEIRELAKTHSYSKLMKIYGVGYSCIQGVVSRKTWKHI